MHSSKDILTNLLRNVLKFQGVVVTDWEDVLKLKHTYHVAANSKDAALMAIEAGIDVCMVPSDMSFYYDVLDLVHEGRLSETRIHQSVLRILTLKEYLGK